MDNSWQTFGHGRVKDILDRQISSQKLPHAYLFSGPEGIGKKTLGLEFAKKVLATDKLENHPDFQMLDLAGEEIKMEAALNFLSKLGFKPFFAQKKVAVINNAENLNQQSSNALLKTLEEPSQSTILILIANSGKLLPTIISRCQVFNFSRFTENDLRDVAEHQGILADEAAIGLSFGSMARLIRLCSDKEFLDSELALLEKYRQLRKMPVAEKLLAINNYTELENTELEQNLTTWLNWQLQELSNEPENHPKLGALSDSLLGLKMNKNKKLLLQNLFLKI